MNRSGWIGVDLDGTIAEYHNGQIPFIGAPIAPMVRRVKAMLEDGFEVRIFTARVSSQGYGGVSKDVTVQRIQDWTEQHVGVRLPVTAEKDTMMVELWDDRAIQVIENTGVRVGKFTKVDK